MTKTQRLLITPTLLNSWLYIYQSKDTDKAIESFYQTLCREKQEQNEAMLKGINFEEECYNGEHKEVYDIIKNGTYQIVSKRLFKFDNNEMLCYGRLDVLKNGVIYDIKRTKEYENGKYTWSSQHWFYMYLFPQVKRFEYLIVDDNNKLHIDTYYNNDSNVIEKIIMKFVAWLKQKGLYEIYKSKWEVK